ERRGRVSARTRCPTGPAPPRQADRRLAVERLAVERLAVERLAVERLAALAGFPVAFLVAACPAGVRRPASRLACSASIRSMTLPVGGSAGASATSFLPLAFLSIRSRSSSV